MKGNKLITRFALYTTFNFHHTGTPSTHPPTKEKTCFSFHPEEHVTQERNNRTVNVKTYSTHICCSFFRYSTSTNFKMSIMDVLSDFDLKSLLGKLLGVLIIVGSMLNKAPLFFNILKSKSVAGMASSSVYSEAIMYSNAAFYGVRQGYPFTAYGETLLIAAQTVMIVVLLWKFKVEPRISMKERSIATALFALYVSVVFALPQDKVYLLLSLNMPVTGEYRLSLFPSLRWKSFEKQSKIPKWTNFMSWQCFREVRRFIFITQRNILELSRSSPSLWISLGQLFVFLLPYQKWALTYPCFRDMPSLLF